MADRLRARREAEYLFDDRGERAAKRLEGDSLRGSGLDVLEIHTILDEGYPRDFEVVVGYAGTTQAAISALVDCGYALNDISVDGER